MTPNNLQFSVLKYLIIYTEGRRASGACMPI